MKVSSPASTSKKVNETGTNRPEKPCETGKRRLAGGFTDWSSRPQTAVSNVTFWILEKSKFQAQQARPRRAKESDSIQANRQQRFLSSTSFISAYIYIFMYIIYTHHIKNVHIYNIIYRWWISYDETWAKLLADNRHAEGWYDKPGKWNICRLRKFKL